VPSGFHLVLEPEAFAPVAAPMRVSEEADTSAGRCVRIPAGLDKKAPRTGEVSLPFSLSSAGTATIWLRCHWSGSCANSVSISVGGRPAQTVGEDGTYGVWHWVKAPPMPLPPGDHKLVLSQREEDVGIDQVVITSDREYVPMGIED
jgi:hypothetical protein